MSETQNRELPILYKNYLKTCRLLELVGGVILIGTILLNEFLHLEVHGFVIPAALIGAVILAIGGSSLLPHNQVKAFAVQLYRSPRGAAFRRGGAVRQKRISSLNGHPGQPLRKAAPVPVILFILMRFSGAGITASRPA